MKKTFRLSFYDIFFLIGAVVIFIWCVFIPPAHSIADQGDFERIMHRCGLEFISEPVFYLWPQRFYEMNFTGENIFIYILSLLFIIPSTSFILPVFIAKLLCITSETFDVRVLAAIMFIWYTLVCFFILRRIKIKNFIIRIVFIIVFLIIFYNGINMTFFNSLYGQSVMLASFATLFLAGIIMFSDISNAKNSYILFFSFASVLLLSSKLQCFVFTPLFIAAVLYAGHKCGRRAICILCAIFIAWHGIGGYFINSIDLNKDTQYNSVFYGVLKNSPNPNEDLRSLGLDEDFVYDIGKNAYMNPSEYKYPPRSEIMEEKFYSKISNLSLIRFYISHPDRIVQAIEITSREAFLNRINLGTFEKKYGFEAGKSSYRFDFWESARAHLPHMFWAIALYWIVFWCVCFYLYKKKNKYAVLLAAMFIMGPVQFAMPYIGNGEADISKQLFLFNIVFDTGVAMVVYILLKKIDFSIQKHTKK